MAAQQHFRAVKAYPRGAFVTVQDDADLGERAVAGVAQGNDLGVRRRQFGDRIRLDVGELGALGDLLDPTGERRREAERHFLEQVDKELAKARTPESATGPDTVSIVARTFVPNWPGGHSP